VTDDARCLFALSCPPALHKERFKEVHFFFTVEHVYLLSVPCLLFSGVFLFSLITQMNVPEQVVAIPTLSLPHVLSVLNPVQMTIAGPPRLACSASRACIFWAGTIIASPRYGPPVGCCTSGPPPTEFEKLRSCAGGQLPGRYCLNVTFCLLIITLSKTIRSDVIVFVLALLLTLAPRTLDCPRRKMGTLPHMGYEYHRTHNLSAGLNSHEFPRYYPPLDFFPANTLHR